MVLIEDEVTLYSAVLVLALLGTRSLLWTTVLTTHLYMFMAMFSFPQVPASRAQQVLHPDSGEMSAVAHRGGGHDAPENTVAAIREAKKNGAAGVELDVEFSADGFGILMHDKTVDRTTNGSGPVSKMRLSDLRQLDAAASHRLRDKFAGEKIPTLEEAVEECIKLQLVIYFDIKGHPDEAAAALKELYKKHPVLYNSSIVCSFEPKVIYRMRQSDPEVVTALSIGRSEDGAPGLFSLWARNWKDQLWDFAHQHVLCKLCGVSALLIENYLISPVYVQYWALRGVEVVVWTVNTKVEKDYFHRRLKVNYITDSLVEDCEPQ